MECPIVDLKNETTDSDDISNVNKLQAPADEQSKPWHPDWLSGKNISLPDPDQSVSGMSKNNICQLSLYNNLPSAGQTSLSGEVLEPQVERYARMKRLSLEAAEARIGRARIRQLTEAVKISLVCGLIYEQFTNDIDYAISRPLFSSTDIKLYCYEADNTNELRKLYEIRWNTGSYLFSCTALSAPVLSKVLFQAGIGYAPRCGENKITALRLLGYFVNSAITIKIRRCNGLNLVTDESGNVTPVIVGKAEKTYQRLLKEATHYE